MRLLSIEIAGFKSFAGRTKLRFPKGLVAIVGPNGCGKSNLVDALRWGLGETSARAVRGVRMDDVIFAGNRKRRPGQRAEVTVVLSDVQGALPIPYDEVAITRAVERNGGADYQLNGQNVRSKEVHSVLSGSGIGKQAFAIFEQGRVDHLLQASPQERRGYFEEVAGISRFKERRKEILRNIDENQELLIKLAEQHTELKERVDRLQQQAAIARAYQEKRQRADELEKQLFLYRWQACAIKLKQIADQQEQHSSDQAAQEQQLGTLTQELVAITAAMQQAQHEWESVRQQRHQHQLELQGQQGQLIGCHARRERSHGRLTQLEAQLLAESQRQPVSAEALLELEAQIAALQQQHADSEGVHNAVVSELNSAKASSADQNIALEALSTKERELQAAQRDTEQRIGRLQGELSQLEKRQTASDAALVHLEQQIAELTAAIQVRTEQHQELQLQLAEQQQQLVDVNTSCNMAQQDLDAARCGLADIEGEIANQRGRLALANQLLDEDSQWGSGGAKLLAESHNPESSLYGMMRPLGELVQVPEGLESLVATALGRLATALVCRSQDDLACILEWARQQDLSHFVLVVEGHRSLEGALGELMPGEHLLGHLLRGIALKTSAELLHTSQPVITLDGWFSDGQGMVARGAGIQMDPVTLSAQRKHAEDALVTLELQRSESITAVRLCQNRVDEVAQQRQHLEREQRKQELRAIECSTAIRDAHKQIEGLQAKRKDHIQVQHGLVSDKEQLNQNLLKQEQQQQALTQELALCIQQQAQQRQQRGLLQAQLEALQSKERDCRERCHQAENALTAALHTKQRQHDQQQMHSQRLIELENEINGEQEELKRIQQQSEAHHQSISQLQQHDQDIAEREKQALQAIELLKGRRAKAEKAELSIKNGQQQQALQLAQLKEQAAHLQRQQQDIEAELRNRLLQEFVAPQGQGTLPGGVTQAEREVRQLRQELLEVKDVNFAAIDEFEVASEQFTFLNDQLSDIESAKTQLDKELRSLEVASRKLFKDALAAVRVHFQENFQRLFSGGSADLKLLDGDPLEAGVEIFAQPPGKQTKLLQLMSGGERSLTALALLLAFFAHRPTPFCLLDEVDAALDEANVERFLHLLEHFMDKTQFFLVTHNKRTMAAADVLYGVSMPEEGVSSVLVLDFVEGGRPKFEPVAVSG